MTAKAEKVLTDGLTETLKITGGTMQVCMVLPDEETLKWVKAQAKGRKHIGKVTFEVGSRSKYPSVKS